MDVKTAFMRSDKDVSANVRGDPVSLLPPKPWRETYPGKLWRLKWAACGLP